MTGAVDTHAHLNHPRLLPKLGAVLTRARKAGVAEIVVVGYDVPSSQVAIQLAEQHADLWATVGIHPHDAKDADRAAMMLLRRLARHPRVVGIGETGLDFHRDLSPRETQLDALRRHLELAAESGLPLICHCRDAEETLLETLADWPHIPIVWHCFDGTAAQAARAIALNVWLGFGGTITYPGSKWRREVAAQVPLAQALLETDAPYLTPYCRQGGRPRDNEPALLIWIAERIAETLGEPRERVLTITAENAKRAMALLSR